MEDDESTIVQPGYLLQILVAAIGFVIVMLLRGSGEKSSIVKVDRCEGLYWGLGAILIAYGMFMSAVAIFVQKQTYDIKNSVNWQFLPGDYKFTWGSAICFPIAGFIFSFSAILFGFTPAFYYIAFLLYLNLQPQVVMYTNAVLAMISTLCSVTLSLIFKSMPYDYFLASFIASLIGAVPGILLQGYVIGLTKRS